MKSYAWKVNFLLKIYGNLCVSCRQNVSGELGHCRIADSKWARRKYKLFIHSVINLMPQCHHCNSYSNRSWGRWSEIKIDEWEQFLERHKKIARFDNGEINGK